MFAIGNDELARNPKVGDKALCPKCGKMHKVRQSVPTLLGYVKCKRHCYMVSIEGKLI